MLRLPAFASEEMNGEMDSPAQCIQRRRYRNDGGHHFRQHRYSYSSTSTLTTLISFAVLLLCVVEALRVSGAEIAADYATLSDNENYELIRTNKLSDESVKHYSSLKQFQQQQQEEQLAKGEAEKQPSAADLRLLYSLLLRDRERLQWQPSRFRPLVQQQQQQISSVSAPISSRSLRNLARNERHAGSEVFIPTLTNQNEVKRGPKMRRAPSMDSFEQWSTMLKTMDNLRKPRFG